MATLLPKKRTGGIMGYYPATPFGLAGFLFLPYFTRKVRINKGIWLKSSKIYSECIYGNISLDLREDVE